MCVKLDIETFDYRNLQPDEIDQLAMIIARDNLPKLNAGFEGVVVPNTFYTRCGKRLLDILISGLALILTSPLVVIVLIITYFDVGSPILFKQRRIGKDGKIFTLVKPRNMTEKYNDHGVLLPGSERVTKWGRFARKTSLDELLNFWSILKGDMSVIGPRPMPVEYYPRFSKRHNMRHKVRPGLECPLHDLKAGSLNWDIRFDNDVWYVQHIGFFTDVKLLLLLLKEALFGTNLDSRATSDAGGDFLGYAENGKIITSKQIPDKYIEEYLSRGEE